MKVEQVGTSRFVNCAQGTSQSGKYFYRMAVADDKNAVMNLYCDASVFSLVRNCQFGDELQLIFELSQWTKGLNVTVKDVILKKS